MYFVSWQDLQWKLHSARAEGGSAPHPGRAALPHAAGEPLAAALPGLHAAQAPAPAVVGGPQPPEAAPEIRGGPSHQAVVMAASLPRWDSWEAGARGENFTSSCFNVIVKAWWHNSQY